MNVNLGHTCLWCGGNDISSDAIPADRDAHDIPWLARSNDGDNVIGWMCSVCLHLSDQEMDRAIAEGWPIGTHSLESANDPEYVLSLLACDYGIGSQVYAQALEFFDQEESE
jgi:hypothetical protein